MINITGDLIAAFKAKNIDLIPESSTDSKTKIPAVTYYESNNIDNAAGDTIGYSDISYTIQIWEYDYTNLISMFSDIDKIMKSFKFKRTSCTEQNNLGLFRKIIIYTTTKKEVY